MVKNSPANVEYIKAEEFRLVPVRSASNLSAVIDLHDSTYEEPLTTKEIVCLRMVARETCPRMFLIGARVYFRNNEFLRDRVTGDKKRSIIVDPVHGEFVAPTVGYVFASPPMANDEELRQLEIYDLVVHDWYQRVGVAKWAVAVCEQLAIVAMRGAFSAGQDEEFNRPFLSRANVNEYREPAIKLFAGAGYRASGIKKDEEDGDYIQFEKTLDPSEPPSEPEPLSVVVACNMDC